jgi:hypothetical protein
LVLPPQREPNAGGYQKLSKKEYDKLKEAHDLDPNGFARAQFAGMGVPSDVVNTIMSGGAGGGARGGSNGVTQIQTSAKQQPAPVKNEINNPIELPQKK